MPNNTPPRPALPRVFRSTGTSRVKFRHATLLPVLLVALTACAVAACAGTPNPIPVLGSDRSIARLAGAWEGAYHSDAAARAGTISFTLRAGTDTAFGEAMMVENRADRDRADAAGKDGVTPLVSPSTRLTIRFVRVSDNEVAGELDPYPDPRCGCQLRTRFSGVMSRDAIEGTYQSSSNEFFHQPVSGMWRVTRVPLNRAGNSASRDSTRR